MVNWLKPFQRREAIGKSATRVLTATDGRDVLLNTPDGWEVDQPWLWWLGPADGSQGPFGNPLPGANDPYGFISLPAVNRATSIICDTIGGLPWQVFRGWDQLDTPNWIIDPQNLARDGRLPTEQGPEIFSVRLSAVEFWTEWIVSALWFGDGYIYCPSRDAAGAPQPPLFVLNPDKVSIDYEAPYAQYYVGDYRLDHTELIHLRGAPPYQDGHGQGVLVRNGIDLALAMTVRQYSGGQYSSGIPYGYLKSGQPRMDEVQANTLRDRWMQQHGSSKRSIAVLNATTEFVPLTVTPLDAQLSDARMWSLRDIALAFGVPAYMLGISGDTSTYANVEGRFTEFKTLSLLPWIRRIESTLDAQLPRGTQLHIKTAGLERADTATRYNAYKTALETGVMTRDEVRALENLPPLGASADPTIPTTDTPIGGADNAAANANAVNGATAG